MARALIVTIALLSLTPLACLRAPAASPQRAIDAWRSMQSQAQDPGAAGAPEAVGAREDGDAIGPEEAYRLALESNPDLAVMGARAGVAEAAIQAARQLENPTLRVSNFDLEDAAQGRGEMTLGLRAPVPRPTSVRAKAIAARLGAEDAEDRVDAARRRLRADIFRRFADLAWLRADREEVERAAAIYDERRRQLRARVASAVATEVELGLAEVAHAEAVDEAARLRGEERRVLAELAGLVDPGGSVRRFAIAPMMGDSAPTSIDLPLDEPALIERALRERPEVRAAQRRVGQAEAAVHYERSEAAPWINWAQVNYYVGASPGAPPIGFGLAVDLPILSWNRGKIRVAKAQVRQRTLEERAEIAAVAAEVRAALGRLRQAEARVQALSGELLPRVDAAAQRAEAALTAGVFDVVEVLDIEARRISARRLHLAALHQRQAAIIELEAAIGAPLIR